jgi:hypothetical protein
MEERLMFVLKRLDPPSYYSANPPMDKRVDHIWSKDINFAKAYLTRNPATRQMNVFHNRGKWLYDDFEMKVVEVNLMEVTNESSY